MNPQMMTQMQIRNNANNMHAFFNDLNEWQDTIKTKDQKLRDGEEIDAPGFYELLDDDGDLLQDVNPEVLGEAELAEHAKATAEKFVDQTRIRPKTYQEYNEWDKFNVDEQLKAFDEQQRDEDLTQKKKAALDRQRANNEKRMAKRSKKQEADDLKEEGNQAFRNGDLDEALECYTLSILANPNLFSSYSNRSAVLHKLGRAADAESDADMAIKLNKRFTKGYLRRGAAREALGKLEDALRDFQHAVTLEPSNKETRKQVRRVKKSLGMKVEEAEEELVEDIPLTEVTVVDCGSDSDYDDAPTNSKPVKKQEVPESVEDKSRKEMLAQLVEPDELPLPRSSTQFEHVWGNVLKGNLKGQAGYLSRLGAEGFKQLFQQGVEAELFSGLLEVAASSMPAPEAYEILLALSGTGRFDMNVMMASNSDNFAVESIATSMEEVGFTEHDCAVLKKRFGL
eukprot:TRINITY_DN5118_c0_g1_i2.p1 TRINITY_DN5118_c0_g1~~TRINITY_DN5118_c0_g1_i2.p1  ORF type:complete len:454 (-),score=156.29 TRINITY_DN5118_c0_g1_i2:149-1510(-)